MSCSPQRSPLAATNRRLPDGDVRAIFESLHSTRPRSPPSHLNFQIVPVGPNGLKLSPPSYEFDDGLYVLLRPRKKKKNGQQEHIRVPSHLSDLLMEDVPPEICPWSLSGPQFPQPTAIQQRYCYPKGRPDYSNRKGGALWTMYGTDGQEDLEFRLLHVYFSPKRAVNKGLRLGDSELAAATARQVPRPSPSKRPKKGHLAATPTRHHQHNPHQRHHHHPEQSPAITTSSVNTSSSLCSSPLSFDMLPTSPAPFHHEGATPDPFRRFHPIPEATFLTPSPFRRQQQQQHPQQQHSIQQSPVARESSHKESSTTASNTNAMDLYDMDSSLHELDSYWNDPLMNLMLKPSMDQGEATLANNATVKSLAARLESIRESIRESIVTAPSGEQAALTSLVAAWARQVAKDPLMPKQQQHQHAHPFRWNRDVDDKDNSANQGEALTAV